MKQLFLTFLLLIIVLASAHQALAVQYSLIPPSGTLTRGQSVQFTINIDTENSSVSTTQIGLTYDTAFLQYVSAVPGNAMTAVSVTDLGGGKILFSGTNSSGFTGTGVFAYVNFNLIATSPGSTQLCSLWAPTTTIQPTVASQATQPTRLPVTGSSNNAGVIGIAGIMFVAISTGLYFASNNKAVPAKHHHKPKHHV